MTMQEVEYVRGFPPSVQTEPETEGEWKGFSRVLKTKDFKNGESPQSFYEWSYEEPLGERIDVKFDKKETFVLLLSLCLVDLFMI